MLTNDYKKDLDEKDCASHINLSKFGEGIKIERLDLEIELIIIEETLSQRFHISKAKMILKFI